VCLYPHPVVSNESVVVTQRGDPHIVDAAFVPKPAEGFAVNGIGSMGDLALQISKADGLSTLTQRILPAHTSAPKNLFKVEIGICKPGCLNRGRCNGLIRRFLCAVEALAIGQLIVKQRLEQGVIVFHSDTCICPATARRPFKPPR
jgi:hypothetical protein